MKESRRCTYVGVPYHEARFGGHGAASPVCESERWWLEDHGRVGGEPALAASPPRQILACLAQHLTKETPAIIETMIRNWSGKEAVFLGPLVMLQVTQPQACAALRDDERFQPLVLAHVPPDWFVVSKEKQTELKQLLGGLGFSIPDTFKPARAAGDADARMEPTKVRRRRRR